MRSGLEGLLLERSRGTMLEGVAKQLVKQSFQDVMENNSTALATTTEINKPTLFMLLIGLVILLLVLTIVIPMALKYVCYELLKSNSKAWFIVAMLVYLYFTIGHIIVTLIAIIVNIVLLFN